MDGAAAGAADAHNVRTIVPTFSGALEPSAATDAFLDWSFTFRLHLNRIGLIEFIIRDQRAENEANDTRTYVEICIYMRGDAIAIVREAPENHGFQAWQVLTRHYLGRRFARECRLQTQLCKLTWRHDHTVAAFRREFFVLRRNLLSLGNDSAIPDRVLCNLLISAVPSRFDVVLSRYQDPAEEPREDENFLTRLESIFDALTSAELRQEHHSEQDSPMGLAAATTSHHCEFHGRCGHDTKDCNALKRDADRGASNRGGKGKGKGKSYQPVAFPASTSILQTGKSKHYFAIDTGCSDHASAQRDMFSSLTPLSAGDSRFLTVADGRSLEILGMGNIYLVVPTSSGPRPITLTHVLYVPGLATNLLSVKKIIDSGAPVLLSFGNRLFKWQFTDDDSFVTLHKDVLFWLPATVGTAPSHALVSIQVDTASVTQARGSWQQAHESLGHAGDNIVHAIFPAITKPDGHFCIACQLTKTTKVSVASAATPRDHPPGYLIHSDIIGPFPPSRGRKRYAITFSDDTTRFVRLFLMAHKSEAASYFRIFLAEATTLPDFHVRVLHSDSGSEYTGKAMTNLCLAHGIRQQFSPPYTPQRNGVAERVGRTLQDAARAMLSSSGLSEDFWGAAIAHATLIKNVVPHSATKSVPWREVTGRDFDYGLLKPFGAHSYVHVPEAHRGKLGDRAQHGTWIGVDLASMSHRILLSKSGHTVSSLHVSVTEQTPSSSPSASAPQQARHRGELLLLDDGLPLAAPVRPVPALPPAAAADVVPLAPAAPQQPEPDLPPPPIPLDAAPATPARALAQAAASPAPRPMSFSTTPAPAPAQPPRTPAAQAPQVEGGRHQPPREARNRPNSRYAYVAASLETREPNSINEALTSPAWTEALKDEVKSILDANTLTVVPRDSVPRSHTVLPVQVVWKVKYHADGSIARHKARVVCGGHRQKEGIDYNDVFAPTLSMVALRTILSSAAAGGHHVHNLDVKTAFLYADIKEEVYIELPPTMPTTDEHGRALVGRLNKTLYGLHQSPREWHLLLAGWLISQGFTRCTAEPCVFVKNIGTATSLVVAVFVDDIVCCSPSLDVVNAFKQAISARFKMTDNGPIENVLGIQIMYDRSRRTMTLSQHSYVKSVLARFGMSESKPVATPLVAHTTLTKLSDAGDPVPGNGDWYRQVVGSLMYLCTGTRPDLAYAVGSLARFMSNPSEHHLVAAKRVLRYLAGTQTLGLTYAYSGSDQALNVLTGFSDADFAENVENRKSTTGLCFMLNGAAISWASKRQSTVASSTAEAEYTALFSAAKETMYLRQLLAQIGIECSATTIHEDNQPAIHIASNPVTSSNSKHFDVRLHYTREKVEDGIIKIAYCDTNLMVADMMTKSLDRIKLERHRATALGLSDP